MSPAGNDNFVHFITHLTPELRNLLHRTIPFSITYNIDIPYHARWLYHILTGVIDIDTNSGQISHDGLAQFSGMSCRNVIRNIKILEQAGLITVERSPRGARIQNIYHLAGKTAVPTLRHGVAAAPTRRVNKTHPKAEGQRNIAGKYTDFLDM